MATRREDDEGNGGVGVLDQPQVNPLSTPTPPIAAPLILNTAYFQLLSANLRCLVKHLEVVPENKLVTITSFCSEVDYPGVTKWHLKVTFHQSFTPGAVWATLQAAYSAYQATGQLASWIVRPYTVRSVGTNNPQISGLAIPQPAELIKGDAGAESVTQIDWSCPTPPSVNTGAVAATGAVAGSPGYFTPAGATVPANLAALTGVVANPATNWTTGQYVITADLLANNWTGAAWAAGKHA